MGNMLTGRYEGSEAGARKQPLHSWRDRADALRWRTKYLFGLATKDETRRDRAAQVRKVAGLA